MRQDFAGFRSYWHCLVSTTLALMLAGNLVQAEAASADSVAFLPKGANLQKVLDSTGELRLAPDVDYRGFAGKVLKVPNGARIFSRWNARLPVLIVEGGVHDVWIEGLDGGGSEEPDVIFTGGSPNKNITIISGSGGRLGMAGRLKVRLEDDSRVDRLDLAEYGALEVLQGNSGYVRNSIFSHALGYRPGSTVWWEGNEEEPNSGNSFLHISSITPQWKSRWNRAGPLFILSWDCEAWNGNGKGDINCFEVLNSPSVISMGLSGGTGYSAQGGALAKIQEVGLVVDFSSRPRGGVREAADLLFDRVGENYHLYRADIRVSDMRGGLGRFGDFGLDGRSLMSPKVPTGPSASIRKLLESQRFPPVPKSSAVGALSPPMVLSQSSQNGSSQYVSDQAAYLQRLIDRDGLARVRPGIYRLTRSLRLGSHNRVEGVLASAPGEVVLLAEGDFPIIQGRGHIGQAKKNSSLQSVVLSGLALVGGSHGIYWSAESGNIGSGTVIASSSFEHLRFTGQSVAGVAALGIGGLDSNSWRRVFFEDAPVALLGKGKGADFGMNYADKQGFIFCTFKNIREAVWSWDSERASGGHFWYRSAFKNTGNVSRTRAAYNLTWFGSTFEDIRGDRAFKLLDNGSTATGDFFVVSSRWSGLAPAIVSDTASWGVGTYFLGSEFLQQEGLLVGSKEGETLFLWGSSAALDFRKARPERHLVINSEVGGARTGFDIHWRRPLPR